MIVTLRERLSDSPYVDAVTHGYTTEIGSTIRPAETHWHMVLVKAEGNTQLMVVGPLTTAGVVAWGAGGEVLWLRFKLGVFMPHLPFNEFRDGEMPLPGATSQRFWLKGAAWQFPDYDNVEPFVDRLVRDEILAYDPVVGAVIQEQAHELAPRTVRHRFAQATGLTQKHVRQVERAQQAALMLRQGVPILDTVYELGYFDQPHLTRSLRQWVGYTPAQLAHPASSSPDYQHDCQDDALWKDYTPNGQASMRERVKAD